VYVRVGACVWGVGGVGGWESVSVVRKRSCVCVCVCMCVRACECGA